MKVFNKDFPLGVSFNQVVLDNKNISVDNNTNCQEFIVGVDEVVKESKENTKWYIVRKCSRIQNTLNIG